MKKSFSIFIMLVLLTIPSAAQVRIGYYSNDAVMQAMPAYHQVQEDLKALRTQYANETQRADEEFNAKYEEFLDSYSSLATSIRRKRQTELQQSMETNVKFREEAQRLLRQAEEDAIAPLQQKINAAVRSIAATMDVDVVLNTDGNACPYLNPNTSADITQKLIDQLK